MYSSMLCINIKLLNVLKEAFKVIRRKENVLNIINEKVSKIFCWQKVRSKYI